jgi:hypothetical protein
MSITNLTTRLDAEVDTVFACFNDAGGKYYEVPTTAEATEEENLAVAVNCLRSKGQSSLMNKETLLDDVYVAGEIVRKDRPVAELELTEEELQLIPEGANAVIGGRYSGYRPPYSGSGLSIYDQREPPNSLLNSMGKTQEDFPAGLHHWYGIKKDDTTGNLFYKLVEPYHESHGGPDMPHINKIWTAKIYSSEGVADNHVDFFVTGWAEDVKSWCDYNNVAYPLPEDFKQDPWCFGVIWDSEQDSVVAVKAYVCVP